MQKKSIYFFSMIIVLLLLVRPVLANYGLDQTAGAAGLDTSVKDIPTIVGNIVGTGLSLVGVTFFILTLYGGFLWMTAHGNDETVKKALKIITSAIIGLIIVMASYAITTFIFNSLGAGGSASPSSQAGTSGGGAASGATQCVRSADAANQQQCASVDCNTFTVAGCIVLGTHQGVVCCQTQ